MRRCRSAFVALALLVVAGCGGGDDDDSSDVERTEEEADEEAAEREDEDEVDADEDGDEADSDENGDGDVRDGATVPFDGDRCEDDDSALGCRENPAPIGTTFAYEGSDQEWTVRYLDGHVERSDTTDPANPRLMRVYVEVEYTLESNEDGDTITLGVPGETFRFGVAAFQEMTPMDSCRNSREPFEWTFEIGEPATIRYCFARAAPESLGIEEPLRGLRLENERTDDEMWVQFDDPNA